MTGIAGEEPENRNALIERLKGEVGGLVGALSNRAVASLLDKVQGTTGRLNEYVEGGPAWNSSTSGDT